MENAMGILKIEIDKTYDRIDLVDILFFITIVVNNVFIIDAVLYVIPKVLFALFFILEIMIICKSGKLIYSQSLLLPILFFLLETFSIIWSADQDYSVFKWITQVQLFITFLFVFNYMATRGNLHLFIVATYVSGYALAAYTVVRYGFSGIFTALRGATRIGGEINNENAYGMVFAFAALIALFWITQKKSKWHFASMALFSFFALASGSKQAIIVIVAGTIGISFLVYGIRRIWKTMLLMLLLMAGIYIAVNSGLFNSIVERFTSFLSGEFNAGDKNRLMYKITGLKLLSERPILGYGLASFAKVSGYNVYAHDNLLEIGVGMGIIGIVLYYLPWLYAAITLFSDGIENKNGSLMLFVLTMLNIVMGFVSVQYVQRNTWILLAVALGILYANKSRYSVQKCFGDKYV